MSAQLFKRLKAFKKANKVSIADLCKEIGAHFTTYHKWKSAGRITGPYRKIVEEFLEKHEAFTSYNNSASPTSDIAVIGVACYYPGASNTKELWENILARRVQFRRMLDQRLPLSKYYDPDPKAPDKTYLTKAAFIENYQFDWGKLRIPKKTYESTDIAQWLALDIALKTFEDAGYKIADIPIQNTGCIVGNTLTGEQTRSQTLRLRWPYVQGVVDATLKHFGKEEDERHRIVVEMEKVYKSPFHPFTEDSLAGGLANTIAGRVCNYLNLKGGGYIVDGACSSSLLSVATACDALKLRNMDLALAGGVDISLDPFELVGFAKPEALTRNKMTVYDQGASGFLPGEGCGFVLLKRLEDAIKDKNYIYAVIKGWGISSDGRGGIMDPSPSGQSFAIGRAYKNLPYKIADMDFIEGHGTGTPRGDKVELEGIGTSIEQTLRNKNDGRVCGITSFKSVVGHTKAAAGIGGFIKAVLAVNQRILPPTASCIVPNEAFRDKAKHLYPLIQGRILEQKKIIRAGISSAGFGGINSHVTIESKDPPKEDLKPKIDGRALFVSQQQTEIFVFTSRSIVHLKKVIAKFKEDLRNISVAEMTDLAALLNKKIKPRLPIKVSIVTDSPEHLYDALLLLEKEIASVQIEEGQIYTIKANDISTHIILGNHVKGVRIGFLYPGQGSQRLNMTRALVERYKWAQDLFGLSKLPLYENIYKETDKYFIKEEQQEFEAQLADTRITQPAITLSSLIWTEFLTKLGIEPDLVAGHSLGELTAFYKAGAYSKETLIKFAELRGRLMASSRGHKAGGMVSLSCSRQKTEEYISKISGNIILANINSPQQMIVSGGNKEIEKVIELAQKEDVVVRRLNVSNAFHSSLMKSASDKIKSSKVLPEAFKLNGVKVYSGMDAQPIKSKLNIKEYFSKQVISQVNFVGTVETISQDCDIIIEVGPGRVLTDLVKAINKGHGPLCLPIESTAQNDRDLNVILAELFARNVPIKWEELYKNRSIKVFVPASRKKFIENQCERPLRLGNQILKSDTFTASRIEEEAQQIEEVIPGGLPSIDGKDNISDLLIDLTHKITGFERSSLSLNLRLLDDLNLDSIKAAELIGQALLALGIAGQIDPSKISNNTLSQIRDQLEKLVEEKGKSGEKETTSDILKRYQNKPWVRNFIQELIPQEIATRNVNQLHSLKSILILSDKADTSIADIIKDHFNKGKIKVRQISYEEATSKPQNGSIDCLISILPRDIRSGELNHESLKDIIKRLNRIVGLATSNHIEKDAFVLFVQFGGGNFGENGNLKDIASASAKSLASTLYLERSDLKVRVIDFNNQASDEAVIQKVMDELQTYERFNVVGYDEKLKRNIVVYANSKPAQYKKRHISWSIKDVVLVTGGAKGITAQCALEFARTTKAKMILVGRSPLPKKGEDNEITQTIKMFEKEHLKATYYRCDVTDEKNVIQVIKEIEQKEGKVTGFIHGAGLNSLKRIKQVSITEALSESLPKVLGAVNVCKAISPPKLIAAITSIIGVTGMDGSGWYGLANEVLNLYLHQYKAQYPKTEVASIAYSVWDEVGMGAKLGSVKLLANKGIGAIPVQEGVKRFLQLTSNDPGVQQVIVAARLAGLDTWKTPTIKPNHLRYIEKIEYFIPSVELIAQAQLNVKDDPYLLDHNWKGSLLFPFVFGFEAMAQAVACVLGINEFEYIKARDINLERPISVPQDSGTTIEIHAVVLESGKEVKIEIYSQETGYQNPHFSAIFELDARLKIEKADHLLEKRTKEVIDLDAQTDIYGPILFQGKMFQGIKKIYELTYDDKKKEGKCLFTSIYNQSTDAFLKDGKKFNNRFLTGEPFFIDTMLQSMQLIIPQDISLPRDIEEIELIPIKGKIINLIVESKIKKIDGDYYKGDAEVVKDGCSVRIKNCRLKILDTIIDNPSANDLVNPIKRDQSILNNLAAKYSREIGIKMPSLSIAYIAGLRDMNKQVRHKAELSFIEESVKGFLKSENHSIKKFEITWKSDGSPQILGNLSVGPKISLSHEGSIVVCSVGVENQAIDLQTIQLKTREEWRTLLGNRKFELIKDLDGEQLNYIATAIWASGEVSIKAGLNDKNDFQIEKFIDKNYYILKNGDHFFVNLVIQLSRGYERLLSFLMKDYKLFPEPSINQQFGFGDKYFGFNAEYTGPQGKLTTSKKFPVVFKYSKSTSRRVNFSSYCEWIGEIREFSLLSILKQLADVVETKEWGIATNNLKLDIKGEVRGGDIVESKVWLGNKINDNVYDLHLEFWKHSDDGNKDLVALASQRISWVKVLGHGKARVNRLPLFLKDIMQKMEPKSGSSIEQEFPKEFYPKEEFGQGELLKNYELKKFLLSEMKIPTTMEESNLVGNIYFANYPIWISRTTDSYFYKLWPELYTSNEVISNEFFCRRFKIDHLNEAMPFDLINVKMYLERLYTNGVTFKYEIYLSNGNKLAVAQQSMVWVERNEFFVPSICAIPTQIIEGLAKHV